MTTDALLAGDWNVDDTGSLSLNGHAIDTQTNPYASGGNSPAFSLSGAGGDFNQGLNTLTITMKSSDNYLDAVRLDGAIVDSQTATVSFAMPAVAAVTISDAPVSLSAGRGLRRVPR